MVAEHIEYKPVKKTETTEDAAQEVKPAAPESATAESVAQAVPEPVAEAVF